MSTEPRAGEVWIVAAHSKRARLSLRWQMLPRDDGESLANAAR